MRTQKLLYIIGAIIFSSLFVLSFLQIHYAEKRIDALLFTGISAVFFFLLVYLFEKRKALFFAVLSILASASIVMIFIFETIFGGHH